MLGQGQIERARSIGLLTYLQANEPANLKQISRSSYCLADHDSLKISGNGKWFWFSRGFGSNNALDYLVKVRCMPFAAAVETLAGAAACPTALPAKPIPKPGAPPGKIGFALPPRNTDNRRAIAYLQSRGIDHGIIARCIEDGSLYESMGTHSCVFIGKDSQGMAKYAALRGTMGNIKLEARGSDKRFGFCLPAGPPGSKTAAVFESAIDALSFATLEKARPFLGAAHCLSLGGTSDIALGQFLSDHSHIKAVALCLDNDDAGSAAAMRIAAWLNGRGVGHRTMQPARHKDWNDALRSEISERRHGRLCMAARSR